MAKRWAATLITASIAFAGSVFAQDTEPSKAVRLTDAELDTITAGSVVTVAVFPPGNASTLVQKDNITVLVLGSGNNQSGVFGEVVLVSNRGVRIITFPGGH